MAASHTHTAPALDYFHAMRLFMIEAQPDKITTVRDCPSARFAGLVGHAARQAKDPDACKLALQGLDYTNTVDRWYALCTLHQHGAPLPAYAMRVDCRSQPEPSL